MRVQSPEALGIVMCEGDVGWMMTLGHEGERPRSSHYWSCSAFPAGSGVVSTDRLTQG